MKNEPHCLRDWSIRSVPNNAVFTSGICQMEQPQNGRQLTRNVDCVSYVTLISKYTQVTSPLDMGVRGPWVFVCYSDYEDVTCASSA